MKWQKMIVGAVFFSVWVGFGSGCTRSAEEVPREPMAFRSYLIKSLPQVLEATTCQCCNKSLMKCYEETLNGDRVGCPDT